VCVCSNLCTDVPIYIYIIYIECFLGATFPSIQYRCSILCTDVPIYIYIIYIECFIVSSFHRKN
jgi:hypothetical protein